MITPEQKEKRLLRKQKQKANSTNQGLSTKEKHKRKALKQSKAFEQRIKIKQLVQEEKQDYINDAPARLRAKIDKQNNAHKLRVEAVRKAHSIPKGVPMSVHPTENKVTVDLGKLTEAKANENS